jgi:hypothetical protein
MAAKKAVIMPKGKANPGGFRAPGAIPVKGTATPKTPLGIKGAPKPGTPGAKKRQNNRNKGNVGPGTGNNSNHGGAG